MSRSRLTLAALFLAACGGGDSGTGPTVPTVASVTLNQGSATLSPAQTVTLVATPRDASGGAISGQTIAWSTSAPGIATVSGGVVTAVAPGSATITATSSGKSANALITVSAPTNQIGAAGGTVTASGGLASVSIPAGALASATTITITPVASPPGDARLVNGSAFDFGPTGTTFAVPATLTIGYSVVALTAGTNQSQLRLHKLVGGVWTLLAGSSVNTTTHTVSGPTSSFSTYAILEVPAPVATIAISPSDIDLPLGMQVQLAATPRDAQGNTITGKTITWSSGTGAVATIGTGTGLVSSVAVGSTVITATVDGVSGQMTLRVRSDPSMRTLATDKGGGIVRVPGLGIVVVPSTRPASCAVGSDQKGYCWGSNFSGNLGDGTTLDRAAPTAIALGASLSAIAVGSDFSCALDLAKSVWCWGTNSAGTFGNGGVDAGSSTPIHAGGARQYTDLAAGDMMTCGIDTGGGTYCWGWNGYGSLGIGFISPLSSGTVPTPTRIIGDPGLVSISAGSFGTCGLTALGAAWCWGSMGATDNVSTSAVLVPGGVAFAHLSRGPSHACGLTMAHQLYCWGDNDFGQIGDGTTSRRLSPVPVGGALTWRSVSAGASYSCGVTLDNRTFCWGANYEGNLGTGMLTNSLVPVQVGGDMPALALVATGSVHSGLTFGGSAWCWGYKGALGNGEYSYSDAPVRVSGTVGVTDVLRGATHGCYTNAARTLACWAETEDQTSPQIPAFGSITVRAMSSGGNFVCVILNADNHVACWGTNTLGQLGNGTTTSSTVPVPITVNKAFTSLAAADGGACGVTLAQELYCWGGVFGNFTATPTQFMPGLTWATAWGGERGNVCAITTTGAAWCGTPPASLTQIPAGTQWMTMASGGNAFARFDCGLTTAGDAFCRGDNSEGQLGDGTRTARTSMTAVQGGLHFTQIVAGATTVCGLTALPAGSAYCWGSSHQGELGASPAQGSLTPVLVPGGLHFSKLSGGADGFCGVTSDNLAWCWGTRYASALGNGEFDHRALPVSAIGGRQFLLYEPGN